MCLIITSDPQPEAFVEPYFIPAIAGSALSALLPTPLVLPSLGVKILMVMMILMIIDDHEDGDEEGGDPWSVTMKCFS